MRVANADAETTQTKIYQKKSDEDLCEAVRV